MTLLMKIN